MEDHQIKNESTLNDWRNLAIRTPQGEVSNLIENQSIDNWTPHGRLPRGYILFNKNNGNSTNMCFCISFYD
jgi:hypothetical protein